MNLTIQKGIKIPLRCKSPVSEIIANMKQGDSFRLSDELARNSVLRAAKKMNAVMTTRKVNEEDGFNGYRCWRIQ